jgi:hypothetical protein
MLPECGVAFTSRRHSILFSCGILAATLYVAMTLFVGVLSAGYSNASHTVSELSAIGAPTRSLWMLLGTIYTVLMIALGWIVWASAPPNRAQRVLGLLLMIHGAFSAYWPPMHQRAVLAAGGGTLTDTLHIVWTMVTGVLFMLETGFGAAALGKRFRLYSIATMAIGIVCGAMTGTYAARLQAISRRRELARGSASASRPTCCGSRYSRQRSCARTSAPRTLSRLP